MFEGIVVTAAIPTAAKTRRTSFPIKGLILVAGWLFRGGKRLQSTKDRLSLNCHRAARWLAPPSLRSHQPSQPQHWPARRAAASLCDVGGECNKGCRSTQYDQIILHRKYLTLFIVLDITQIDRIATKKLYQLAFNRPLDRP